MFVEVVFGEVGAFEEVGMELSIAFSEGGEDADGISDGALLTDGAPVVGGGEGRGVVGTWFRPIRIFGELGIDSRV